MKKIILFGAGKIGRSFIGQIFSRSGYEVVFVDIDRQLVKLLNDKKSYRVIIKGNEEQILEISPVRALYFDQENQIIDELITADLMAVSVGQSGLKKTFPLIARALISRHAKKPSVPLDIIIAENLRNAGIFFRNNLSPFLDKDFPLDQMAGLIETSIGKMVPIMTKEDLAQDPLQLFAEPYNTLILDRMGFRNPVPEVPWLAPKNNMKAWVDRKSFIHNLGHAVAAYLGKLKYPDKNFLYEVLEDRNLYIQVRKTMVQAGEILIRMYPEEFTEKDIMDHIDDLLKRFMNKALKDTIYRVGCDLQRKLGPDDRLVSPIREALKFGMDYDLILYALISGFYFRATDEKGEFLPDDIEFYNKFMPDINYLLITICKFDRSKHHQIFYLAKEICRTINRKFKPEVLIK